MNDVRPPRVELLTRTLTAGRPTIVAKVTDAKSGVDPLSLLLFFGRAQITGEERVSATMFDPQTGRRVPHFGGGRARAGLSFMRIVASDFQETKNIADTASANPMPNTNIRGVRVQVVNRPTVTWIMPGKNACLAARQRLLVVANDNVRISSWGSSTGTARSGACAGTSPGSTS